MSTTTISPQDVPGWLRPIDTKAIQEEIRRTHSLVKTIKEFQND